MSWFKRDKKEEIQAATASKASTASLASSVLKSGKVASDVISRPIVTEKSAHLAAQGQYIFEVDPKANKIQVKNAIRTMYSVIPTSVNIQSVEGKQVRFGRTYGKRKDWKKAIVTLKKGQKIEVYEGV